MKRGSLASVARQAEAARTSARVRDEKIPNRARCGLDQREP
jgi:hypothetical protein